MTVDELHNRIEQMMCERGWSGYKLAQESNISWSTYYNMMERRTMPKIETLEKICVGLHTTVSDLLREDFTTQNYVLTKQEEFLIEEYRRMDQRDQERIIGYFHAIRSMESGS